MEIDGALVMENFLSEMKNFFMIMGFFGVITLCLVGLYIYMVYIYKKIDPFDISENDENEFGDGI